MKDRLNYQRISLSRLTGKTGHRMYSHPATKQDEWVMENSEAPGIFVELGAYDGLRHSNTLLLEESGWHGYLVEGHPPFAQYCRVNRPQTQVVNKFIGDGEPAKVYVGGQYTGRVNTMPEEFVREHQQRKNESYLAATCRLATAIDALPVDYLSLDTEGGEVEILRDWFADGGSCRLLTVEFRFDNVMLNRLQRLCEDNAMELVEIRGFDACFRHVAW